MISLLRVFMMEHILDPDSPLSPSVSANSDNLAFVDHGHLLAPSPSPLSHVSPTPAPPAMQGVIGSPVRAVAPCVIVAPDDEVLVQDGTPEPEMVPIASGRCRGQLCPRVPKGYRGKSVLLTYPNLNSRPRVATVHAEFSKHHYHLRQLIGCFERHNAGHDENGQVVADWKWHMHIFGHICLNSRGDPPNIKTVQPCEIRLDGRMCHANISPVRNHTDVWYANSNPYHYSRGVWLMCCSGVMSGR